MGLFKKLKEKIFKKKTVEEKVVDQVYDQGLKKARENFSQGFKKIEKQTKKIDAGFWEELENLLIMSDVSVPMVMNITEKIKSDVEKLKITKINKIKELLIDEMFAIYTKRGLVDTSLNIKQKRINVILVVGVNGVGKTTTIGKLAHHLKKQNHQVALVAADTFRAGAVEQLKIWATRLGVDCVCAKNQNQDPASVIYDGLDFAIEKKLDVLICDTAGRVQSKINLMNEISKIKKIIARKIPDAPHEILLVLDATTGQNGISQAKAFQEATDVTGIILTKMDGTSKGGIILGIQENFDIPVKYIGLGEKLEDLQEFDLDEYVINLMKGLVNFENN